MWNYIWPTIGIMNFTGARNESSLHGGDRASLPRSQGAVLYIVLMTWSLLMPRPSNSIIMFQCLYIYRNIYIYIYMHVYIYIQIHIYIYIYKYIHIFLQIHMYIHTYINIIYIYIYKKYIQNICIWKNESDTSNTLRANCPAKLMGPAVYVQIAQQCISKHRPARQHAHVHAATFYNVVLSLTGRMKNFKTHEALVSCS